MSNKYEPIREISEEAYQLALLAAENKVECGHYDFSDGAYANVLNANLHPIPECGYEAHRKYIDIQMVIEGEEVIGIEDLETMRAGECVFTYDEKKDAELWRHNDNGTHHHLKAGDYLIILPEHAHMPGACPEGGVPKDKKMIIKAPVTLLKK